MRFQDRLIREQLEMERMMRPYLEAQEMLRRCGLDGPAIENALAIAKYWSEEAEMALRLQKELEVASLEPIIPLSPLTQPMPSVGEIGVEADDVTRSKPAYGRDGVKRKIGF